MSTRIPLFAALVLAFALVAPLSTSPAPAAATDGLQHIRMWSIGDSWEYWKEPTSNDPAQTQGSIKSTVVGTEIITLDMWDPEIHDENWQRHAVYKVKLWANQTANSGYGPATIKSVQDRYVRNDDLALAKLRMESSYIFLDSPAYNSNDVRTSDYFPPQIEYAFPFAVEDQWRMHSTSKTLDPGPGCGGENMPPCKTTGNHLDTYTVLGEERVTLTVNGASQTFDTYRIKVIDEYKIKSVDEPEKKKYEIWWWSAEVCNLVKKEEYNNDGVRQFLHTLQNYKCKGKTVADPRYVIYDYQNFSSTRRDGELYHDPVLDLLAGAKNGGESVSGGGGGGGGVQLWNGSPGPGFALFGIAIVAAAMWAGRRRA